MAKFVSVYIDAFLIDINNILFRLYFPRQNKLFAKIQSLKFTHLRYCWNLELKLGDFSFPGMAACKVEVWGGGMGGGFTLA